MSKTIYIWIPIHVDEKIGVVIYKCGVTGEFCWDYLNAVKEIDKIDK